MASTATTYSGRPARRRNHVTDTRLRRPRHESQTAHRRDTSRPRSRRAGGDVRREASVSTQLVEVSKASAGLISDLAARLHAIAMALFKRRSALTRPSVLEHRRGAADCPRFPALEGSRRPRVGHLRAATQVSTLVGHVSRETRRETTRCARVRWDISCAGEDSIEVGPDNAATAYMAPAYGSLTPPDQPARTSTAVRCVATRQE